MRARLLLALAAIVALLVPAVAIAQAQHSGAFLHTNTTGVAGKQSGIEIEAGERGFYFVFLSSFAAPNAQIYITDASVIDEGLTEITPKFKFGSASLTSVVRKGVGPTTSRYNKFYVWPPNIFTEDQKSPPYVPPGKFLNIRRTSVGGNAYYVVGFVEPPR